MTATAKEFVSGQAQIGKSQRCLVKRDHTVTKIVGMLLITFLQESWILQCVSFDSPRHFAAVHCEQIDRREPVDTQPHNHLPYVGR